MLRRAMFMAFGSGYLKRNFESPVFRLKSAVWTCHRQSIDLYSSVPSPSLNFLGTPSLSRLGSSFLSSSLTRRHTPEILPTLSKPLIPEAEKPKERRSSHSLLPPIPSRKSSLKKITPDGKPAVSHELPIARHSSYGQAVLNGKY